MKFVKVIPALLVMIAFMAAPIAKAEDAVKKADAPTAKVEKMADAKADAKTADADGKEKKECEHCKKSKHCKDCKDGKMCKKCKEAKKNCKHCNKDKHDQDAKEESKEGDKAKK